MDQGMIVADGDSHSILSDENLLVSANLEVPTALHLSRLMGLPPLSTLGEINRAMVLKNQGNEYV